MKDVLKKQIALQIYFNQNRNLLSNKGGCSFIFTTEMKQLIQQLAQNVHSKHEENDLLHHTVSEALSSFYRINQYYNFDSEAQSELRSVYQVLLSEIKEQDPANIDYTLLAGSHFMRLQKWLIRNYPAAAEIYGGNASIINHPVVCAEYTATTQMEVLNLREETLKGPILDIGCGKQHHLVRYLQLRGYEAFGIDRETVPSSSVYRASWLEFSFVPNHWGTIISHLGFTNHFWHQHLLQDGLHHQYAATYMQILHSLQQEGCFYYAPGLPFIEAFLDPQKFEIKTKPIKGTQLTSVRVKRIC
jgi:hypothetical protein